MMDALHLDAAPGASLRLAEWPPALVVTERDDAMRDEAKTFAQRPRDAGVRVQSRVLEGASNWPHARADP